MASGELGMGKEVAQGIGGGLVAILICVTIGSMIGSALSHGPKEAHTEGEGHNAATEQPAAGAEGETAKPAGETAKPAEGDAAPK